MSNIYDDDKFFQSYAMMDRSMGGLKSAGEWHQLEPLIPDLEGKSVLDLGCGYGWHCKYAVQKGAYAVFGIDSSKKMIAKAIEINSDEKIKYSLCGINEYNYPENSYDFVISNLVLHYIENLEEVYQNVHHTLKSGGCFLFNIEHPVFTAGVGQDWIYNDDNKPLYWPVDNYYYTGKRETNFLGQSVVKQHHTLSQILNLLLKTGFQIEAVEEAMPPQDMMSIPGMIDEMRRPMMLIIKAKKFDRILYLSIKKPFVKNERFLLFIYLFILGFFNLSAQTSLTALWSEREFDDGTSLIISQFIIPPMPVEIA